MKCYRFSFLLGCSLLGLSSQAWSKTSVVVEATDTVYGVAYKHGVTTRSVISANNLTPPYSLKKGQTLIIPSPNEHIVGRGETLQNIAANYGVRVDLLAQENSITSPYFVREGETLLIPSRDTTPMAEALAPASQDTITVSSLEPLPLLPKESSPSQAMVEKKEFSPPPLPKDVAGELALEKDAGKSVPPITKTKAGTVSAVDATSTPPLSSSKEKEKEKDKDKDKSKEKVVSPKVVKKDPPTPEPKKEEAPKVAESSTPTFIWPVKGTVIGKFSPGKNDGINIEIPEGTDVKASADGEVMYAGNELKSLGNLILIRHKNGFVTAYAHNSKLLASKGDRVKQGKVIAKSGKTGDVNRPQLHFEVREGKEPRDPSKKLGS